MSRTGPISDMAKLIGESRIAAGTLLFGVESIRTGSDWQCHTGPTGIGDTQSSVATEAFGKNISLGLLMVVDFASWMNGELNVGG